MVKNLKWNFLIIIYDKINHRKTKATDYELLDSGEGEKNWKGMASMFCAGRNPQASWSRIFNPKRGEWQKRRGVLLANGRCAGGKVKPGTPGKWQMEFGRLKFWIRPTAFKHTGLFRNSWAIGSG